MFGTLPIYQVTIDSTAGEPNIYGTRRWWYNFQQPRNLFPYPPVFPNIAIAGRISSFSIESIYRLNQRVQPFHPAMFVHRSVMFCFPPPKKRSKHPRLQVYNLKSLTKKWQLSNNPQPAIFSPIFCGEKKKGEICSKGWIKSKDSDSVESLPKTYPWNGWFFLPVKRFRLSWVRLVYGTWDFLVLLFGSLWRLGRNQHCCIFLSGCRCF